MTTTPAGRTAIGLGCTLTAAVLFAGTATAEPAPPADPTGPAPAETTVPVLGARLQVDPLAALGGLLASSPQPPVLGLAPLPAGTVSTAPPADPMAFTQLLLPQNFRMPDPDQLSPYPLAPNDVPSPFARIDAWKGVHALTHGGLGRMPGGDLGQPLPGTAPPPGTNIPPGLEQFYVEPTPPQASVPPA